MFDLYPSLTPPATNRTNDLRAALANVDGDGKVVISLAPGDYYFAKVGNGPILGSLLGRIGVRLVGYGARIIHDWRFDSELGNFYVGDGGADHSFEGFTYEPIPRVDTQGYVYAVADAAFKNDFKLAIAPEFVVPWSTADNLLRIIDYPDGSYGCDAWQYELGGAARTFSFASTGEFDSNGLPIYLFSPFRDVVRTSTVGSSDAPDGSHDALVFTMNAGRLKDGDVIIPDAYPDVISFINEKAYSVVLGPGGENAITFFIKRNGIFASTLLPSPIVTGSDKHSDITDSTVMKVRGVPKWIVKDAKIVVQHTKHGANPFYARGVKGDLRFDKVQVKGALAVPFYIWDFHNLYLDVLGQGDGYISANAGPVNVFNGQSITGPGIEWHGSGDDVFNPRTRAWQSKVPSGPIASDPPIANNGYGGSQGWDLNGNWIDVKFNSPYGATLSNAFGNNPTTPSLGDQIEISGPDAPLPVITLTVDSLAVASQPGVWTSPAYTRVTFSGGSIPMTFDPTKYRIINRSTVPAVDLDQVYTVGCGGRSIVCQSHDMHIGQVTAIGGRFSNILAAATVGGREDENDNTQIGDGGFRGNLRIDYYKARHSSVDALADGTTEARALLRVEALSFNQESLNVTTDWMPVTVGYLDVDDYPWTGIYAEGVNVTVGLRSVSNGGTRRAATDAQHTPQHGDFDYSAKYATIDLAGPNWSGQAENKEQDMSGMVIIGPSVETIKAGFNVTGGGTIMTGPNSVGWSNKFIVAANGRGTDFATAGTFEISVPAELFNIPGVGGATNAVVSGGKVPLAPWCALYYILPLGSGATSVSANFRVVGVSADINVPSEWLLIAMRNGDNGSFRLCNGLILNPNQSFDTATYSNAFAPNAAKLGGQAGTFYAPIASPSFTGTTSVQKLVQGDGSTLTVDSNGAILATGSYHKLETPLDGNGNHVSSVDLVTINGGVEGQILMLRPLVANRTVVVKGGTTGGNIALLQGGDAVLGGANFPHLTLVYSVPNLPATPIWREVTRPGRSTGLTTYSTDADATFTVSGYPETVMINAPFSTSPFRNLALSSDKATRGDKFRLSNVRPSPALTSPHVRNLTAGGTDLYTLAQGKWADFIFDGTNWLLVASGAVSA